MHGNILNAFNVFENLRKPATALEYSLLKLLFAHDTITNATVIVVNLLTTVSQGLTLDKEIMNVLE